jgi:N-alpha-acetyltransferase 10/11
MGSALNSLEEAMASVYKAAYVSLHVRKSNKAAIGLYRDTLGFEVAQVVKKYCQYLYIYESLLIDAIICVDGDGEDALSMRLALDTA